MNSHTPKPMDSPLEIFVERADQTLEKWTHFKSIIPRNKLHASNCLSQVSNPDRMKNDAVWN